MTSTPVSNSTLRSLSGKTFYIKGVFNPYRTGWLDSLKKFRTFIYFGKADDEVLYSGTDRIKEFTKEYENSVGKELREKTWNKEERRFEFSKVKEQIGKDFFKAFGKVFDVEIITAEPIEVEVYNKETKSKEKQLLTEIIIQGVSAGKIKSLIASVVDEEPPMVDGKDKAGNPAKVPAYDFEDTFKDKLVGKYVKVKVTGQGMDTKYIFNEGKEFTIVKDEPIVDKKFEEIFDTPF